MPASLVFIVFLVIGIITGLIFYFFQKNKKIQAVHLQQQIVLQEGIKIHTSQIQFRNKSLDKYHFLTYNLEEALVVQQEILVF